MSLSSPSSLKLVLFSRVTSSPPPPFTSTKLLCQRSVYATTRRRTSTNPSSSSPSSLFGPSFYTFPRYRTMDLASLTEDPSSWKGSSVLSVNQITPSGLELLFTVAQEMRTLVRSQGGDSRLQHKLVSTIFYEASTRTACSFQAAMMRLGGKHIHGECVRICDDSPFLKLHLSSQLPIVEIQQVQVQEKYTMCDV